MPGLDQERSVMLVPVIKMPLPHELLNFAEILLIHIIIIIQTKPYCGLHFIIGVAQILLVSLIFFKSRGGDTVNIFLSDHPPVPEKFKQLKNLRFKEFPDGKDVCKRISSLGVITYEILRKVSGSENPYSFSWKHS